jgi:SAM-dependent methyltransferase
VLDLGCNAGFWSLAAVMHDADFVLEIDGRPVHVEQARLVFEASGIQPRRYDFRCANVFDVLDEDIGRFDVVLCLRLLYHVSKPMSLIEWVARVNTDVLVIDTDLADQPGSVFEVRRDDLSVPGDACDYGLVMCPSRAAVIELARAFQYDVRVLRPRFTSWRGAEDFERGLRRAFVCAKRSDLRSIDARSEPAVVPRDELVQLPARSLVAALGRKLVRRLGRRR